ncbi:MAG: hypothetical protein K0R63_881 [Rickettsiales bacterium]|jgi:hypothetical protein|nr:hypothetical protein [Rickettsiales bacterium]
MKRTDGKPIERNSGIGEIRDALFTYLSESKQNTFLWEAIAEFSEDYKENKHFKDTNIQEKFLAFVKGTYGKEIDGRTPLHKIPLSPPVDIKHLFSYLATYERNGENPEDSLESVIVGFVYMNEEITEIPRFQDKDINAELLSFVQASVGKSQKVDGNTTVTELYAIQKNLKAKAALSRLEANDKSFEHHAIYHQQLSDALGEVLSYADVIYTDNNAPVTLGQAITYITQDSSNIDLKPAVLFQAIQATTRTDFLEYGEATEVSLNTPVSDVKKILESQTNVLWECLAVNFQGYLQEGANAKSTLKAAEQEFVRLIAANNRVVNPLGYWANPEVLAKAVNQVVLEEYGISSDRADKVTVGTVLKEKQQDKQQISSSPTSRGGLPDQRPDQRIEFDPVTKQAWVVDTSVDNYNLTPSVTPNMSPASSEKKSAVSEDNSHVGKLARSRSESELHSGKKPEGSITR